MRTKNEAPWFSSKWPHSHSLAFSKFLILKPDSFHVWFRSGVMNWLLTFTQIPQERPEVSERIGVHVYVYLPCLQVWVSKTFPKNLWFKACSICQVLRTFANFVTSKIISYGVWLITLWLWSDFKVSSLEYWHVLQSSGVQMGCDLLFSSFNNLALCV